MLFFGIPEGSDAEPKTSRNQPFELHQVLPFFSFFSFPWLVQHFDKVVEEDTLANFRFPFLRKLIFYFLGKDVVILRLDAFPAD